MPITIEELQDALNDAMEHIEELAQNNPRERLVQEINFQAPMYNYFRSNEIKKYITHIEANYTHFQDLNNGNIRPPKCDLRMIDPKDNGESWLEIKVAAECYKSRNGENYADAKPILQGGPKKFYERWIEDYERLYELAIDGEIPQKIFIVVCFFNYEPNVNEENSSLIDRINMFSNTIGVNSNPHPLNHLNWQGVPGIHVKAWIWSW